MERPSLPSLTHDAVTLTLIGLLAGVGTVFAVVSHFDLLQIAVYVIVAALVVLGAVYIRERPPGEPPDEHR